MKCYMTLSIQCCVDITMNLPKCITINIINIFYNFKMFCFSVLVLSSVLLIKCFCMFLCFSLLTISRYNSVALYNISDNAHIFDQIMRMTIPHDPIDYKGSPNSAHWLWDGTLFTVGTIDSVHFWDSSTFKIIETVQMPTKVLNHVMAAKKFSGNKHVAGT